MFNYIKIKYVRLLASKIESDKVYKIFKIAFDSGLNLFYLSINDEYAFDFFNDIQMYNYISINGFAYENK